MKKRFLRRITVDTEDPLPENIVQVVSVGSIKVYGLTEDRKAYRMALWVVVEEDVKNE